MFRSTRSLHIPTRELPLSPDTTAVLHQVYSLLLGLLARAKLYVDAGVHGTTKLVQYFSFMTYCLISKTEKLMFSGYFMDLWNLFQVSSTTQILQKLHYTTVAEYYSYRILQLQRLHNTTVAEVTQNDRDRIRGTQVR